MQATHDRFMRPRQHLWMVLAALGTCGTPALATVLVHEGFRYELGDNVELHGKTVTAEGLTGTWTRTETVSSSGNFGAHFRTSGLSFGGLVTTGGSLRLAITPGSTSGEEALALGAAISPSVSGHSGTLFQSFLVRMDVRTLTIASDQSNLRLVNVVSSTSNYNDSPRLQAAADAATDTDGMGIAYSASSDNITKVGYVLPLGETFWIVAKWTNVGQAGGGTGTLWGFTESAFAAWQEAGGTEAALTAQATFSKSTSKTTQADFSHFVQFFTREGSSNGSGTLEATYDELWYGTSLPDVVAKPAGTLILIH